jgi:hypothetical protein
MHIEVRLRRNLAMAILLLVTTGRTLADGKMYVRETVPANIPYQRALILFKDGTETLILQSKYEIAEVDTKTAIGWVVPVPAVPEVASLPADRAEGMFFRLSRVSQPEVTRVSSTIRTIFVLGLSGFALLTLVLYLVSFLSAAPSVLKNNQKVLGRLSLCALLIAVVLWPILLPSLSGGRGVDVIAEHHVGVYDVRVIRSDSAAGLIEWLNANQYKFGEEDKAAFASCISRGWCFVVANIQPWREQDEEKVVANGLAAPLVLRFPYDCPIYPVALTGTANQDTEILIYVSSETKVACNNRLTLRYAGPTGKKLLQEFREEIEPRGFFKPDDLQGAYLCKFRDRLTPAQMSQDIVFSQAGDSGSYREHLVQW